MRVSSENIQEKVQDYVDTGDPKSSAGYVVSVSGGVTRYDSGGRGNTRLVSRVSQQDAGWPHPLVMLCPDFKVIKSTFYICQRGNCIRYD